ncbi:MAG: OsmC family protein [Chitinophagales bacterium]|nr:OsmC family protein [Chitinophagales bacterium]
MTSTITYLGNLRTQATHIKSSEKIITDAPTDNQGKGEAFSPTDLVATALGSCMLTVMGIKAREMQVDLTGAEISITKIMGTEPRRITEIVVAFSLAAPTLSEKEKAILENTARTCPVFYSLHPELTKTISFNWN